MNSMSTTDAQAPQDHSDDAGQQRANPDSGGTGLVQLGVATAQAEHGRQLRLTAEPGSEPAGGAGRMSYKFQRLREKLRIAVASGELTGKLPGERALAKRFHVNAKTLSKALTDLAAEGLLDRSIGRGTYVKGATPAPAAPARWLVLCDGTHSPAEAGESARRRSDVTASDGALCLVDQLRRFNPDLHVSGGVGGVSAMRPSFLNGFGA